MLIEYAYPTATILISVLIGYTLMKTGFSYFLRATLIVATFLVGITIAWTTHQFKGWAIDEYPPEGTLIIATRMEPGVGAYVWGYPNKNDLDTSIFRYIEYEQVSAPRAYFIPWDELEESAWGQIENDINNGYFVKIDEEGVPQRKSRLDLKGELE